MLFFLDARISTNRILRDLTLCFLYKRIQIDRMATYFCSASNGFCFLRDYCQNRYFLFYSFFFFLQHLTKYRRLNYCGRFNISYNSIVEHFMFARFFPIFIYLFFFFVRLPKHLF